MSQSLEKDIAIALSKQHGVPYASRENKILKAEKGQNLENILPAAFARENFILPLFRDEDVLGVAVSDPENILLLDNVKMLTGLEVQAFISTKTQIVKAIDDFYSNPARKRAPSSRVTSRRSRRSESRPLVSKAELAKLFAHKESSGYRSGMKWDGFHNYPLRDPRVQWALRQKTGVILVSGATMDWPWRFLVRLGNLLSRRGKDVLGIYDYPSLPEKSEFRNLMTGPASRNAYFDFLLSAAYYYCFGRTSPAPDVLLVNQIRDPGTARAVYELSRRALVLTVMLGDPGNATSRYIDAVAASAREPDALPPEKIKESILLEINPKLMLFRTSMESLIERLPQMVKSLSDKTVPPPLVPAVEFHEELAMKRHPPFKLPKGLTISAGRWDEVDFYDIDLDCDARPTKEFLKRSPWPFEMRLLVGPWSSLRAIATNTRLAAHPPEGWIMDDQKRESLGRQFLDAIHADLNLELAATKKPAARATPLRTGRTAHGNLFASQVLGSCGLAQGTCVIFDPGSTKAAILGFRAVANHSKKLQAWKDELVQSIVF